MKFGMILIGLIGTLLCGLASANTNVVTIEQIANLEITRSTSMNAMINWQVGDSQDYKVSLGGFGMEGTMHKEATKEEGNAIWVVQDLKLPIMNDKSEMLIDRNSGKVLKFIRNGKEEKAPEGDIEIISTKSDVVTVPAGKFKVLHIKAKSKDVQDIQIWMNNRDISLDGAAKMYMDQGMIKITMELTKFIKKEQE